MGVALSMLLTVAALALLALAMRRHHRQLAGRPPSATAALAFRLAGAALLLVAPVSWMAQTSPAMGFVTWFFCAVPLAALVVVALFAALPASPGE